MEQEEKSKERFIPVSDGIFRDFFENSAVGMSMTLMDGRIITNKTFRNLLGYSEEELISIKWMDITYPDDVVHDQAVIQQLLSGEKTADRWQKRYFHKNGSIIWVDIATTLQRDEENNPLHFITTVNEITAQVQLQGELKQRESGLQESQRIARLGSYDFDLVSGFWTSSEIMDEIFGIDQHYVRSFEGWAGIIHPEYQQEMVDYVANEVVGKKKDFDKEYKIIRINDLEERWLHGRGKLKFDADGNPVRLIGTIMDITEHRKILDFLMESEERYRLLMETLPDGVIVHSQGKIIYANPAISLLSGLSDPLELLGRSALDFVHPDYRELAMQRIQHSMITGLPAPKAEEKFILPDGSGIDVEVNAIPFLFDGQKAMLTVIKDIRGRKKNEEVLLENAAKLQMTIDEAPVSVAMVGLDQRFLMANAVFCDYLGYSEEELKQKTISDITHPEDRNIGMSDMAAIIKGEKKTSKVQKRYLRKNGTVIWGEVTISLIHNRDGKPMYFLPIIQDITDRKKAEIIQQIQFAIAREVVLAETLEQILLTVRNELSRLLDTTNFFVALYHAENGTLTKVVFLDEKDKFVEWKAKGTYSGEVALQVKTIMLSKEEARSFAEKYNVKLLGSPSECWLGVPLLLPEKVLGVMVVQSYTDPAAYNQADALLMEMVAQELSHYMERSQMIEDLVVAKEKAEESDRLKSSFLANMSHEIRTPLNSIIGFSELLSSEENDPKDVVRFSNIIQTSGNRMLQLISNLIDISKIESGTEAVRLSNIFPLRTIREVVGQFQIMAEKKSIKIVGIYPAELNELSIQTDALKIEQILTNLVNNALKFTSEGSILVGLERQSSEIMFFVRDSGIGIPANNVELIFDRFYQVDSIHTLRSEGAGLGLSLCKGMVELLGGRIWVESEEGKGSTFYFTIPNTNTNA